MLHKVRSMFAQNDSIALTGEVEVDEMYNGGKQKWMHECKKKEHTQGGAGKTSIVGMVERDTKRVVAVKTPDTKSETVIPLIDQFVCTGKNVMIYTDESRIYNQLCDKLGVEHKTCNHKEKVFSDGNGTHTNTIEAFWSHFRRMVTGIYHHISEDYTQRYIDEESFRWNTRKDSEGERFEYMFKSCIGVFDFSRVVELSSTRKTYKKVVA